MSKIEHTRFKDAEWYGLNKEIIIGGVGGTGSWLSLFISRTGDHIMHLYDDDVFERHNIAGQFVRTNQLNTKKVRAVSQNIGLFGGSDNVYDYDIKFTESSPITEVMFACFDNMSARQLMWDRWKAYVNRTVAFASEDRKEEVAKQFLFVDLRLVAESLTIFMVQGHHPEDFERYEANLFPDAEVPDADCTLKQTSHAAGLIATLTTGFFTNWLANRKQEMEYRTVPFRTDYMIAANLFENE